MLDLEVQECREVRLLRGDKLRRPAGALQVLARGRVVRDNGQPWVSMDQSLHIHAAGQAARGDVPRRGDYRVLGRGLGLGHQLRERGARLRGCDC